MPTTACPAKTRLQIDFLVAQTEASAAGNHDGFCRGRNSQCTAVLAIVEQELAFVIRTAEFIGPLSQ